MPTGKRYGEGIRKRKKNVDPDEKLLLRLKSNRLRLRPRSEPREVESTRSNVEEIIISGKKFGASTPKVDMK
jgi:hypothetical protein